MRILHTSDWHLGQSFYGFDRAFEHQQYFDWLLDIIVREAVDVLLVAGDLFDNSNPAASAQHMLYQFLTQAKSRVAHLNIVLIAGNHDSAGRLEAPAPILSFFQASVVGQISPNDLETELSRALIPLKNAEGSVQAWCIAVPFLRSSDLPRSEVEDGDAYAQGVKHLYALALEKALSLRSPGQALIAMGHCHMTGGQSSNDSERRIVIGGAEALPVEIFGPEIAYVALGHLHLAQSVGHETRRYSGSPLPMSFSEIQYPHQVVMVDLNGDAVTKVRQIPIPRTVDLIRIPESPAPLNEVLDELSALTLPNREEAFWPYLLVRVQLNQSEPGLRAQIEAALEGKPVRLARIEVVGATVDGPAGDTPVSLDELNSLKPEGFFQRLYEHRFGNAAPPELMQAFSELLNSEGGQE